VVRKVAVVVRKVAVVVLVTKVLVTKVTAVTVYIHYYPNPSVPPRYWWLGSHLTIIDLDTIDTSNLNRQFLFQSIHVHQSKAMVAKQVLSQWKPNNIIAYCASIFESKFDFDFYKGFDLVMNCLDNVAARRHVNRMCVATRVPLIESGSLGYHGQVQLHYPPYTNCYDCTTKPIQQKSWPICTIRSTPSLPIHCIVWAKDYLFHSLFGTMDPLVEIDPLSENKVELEMIQKENEQMLEFRTRLDQIHVGKQILDKVFCTDIQAIMKIKEFVKKPLVLDTSIEPRKPNEGIEMDQNVWTLQENVYMFLHSLQNMAKKGTLMEWCKDDVDSLNFVTSASNIRSFLFGIDMQTRFQVKEMAGNIIHAIATTNAIVGGMMVFMALLVIQDEWKQVKNTFVAYGGDRLHVLLNEPLPKPNPECMVCSSNYVQVGIPPKTRLNEFTNKLKQVYSIQGYVSIQVSSVLNYDEMDFNDNASMEMMECIQEEREVLMISEGEVEYSLVVFLYESRSDVVD
jgi:ubiquitin-like 1-activating enzyme E1 B